MTLLRLVRALPDPDPGAVTGIGVDDFAFRRGHRYGTVIIDIETHRPIDVLPDRTRHFAAWLRGHPGLQVICRDRAGAYAEGARLGAPAAVQVADRWHLWHNLTEAVAEDRHRRTRRAAHPARRGPRRASEPVAEDPELVAAASEPSRGSRPDRRGGRGAARIVEAVRHRGAGGAAGGADPRTVCRRHGYARRSSISGIARELRLTRHTVRRFARAESIEDLLVKAGSRGSLLDPFKPYLHHGSTPGTPTPPR